MIYLITAAGDGKRFRDVGYETAKPLLKIRQKEALLWSIDSLPLKMNDQLIIISRKEHEVQKKLKDKIKEFYSKVKVDWLEIEKLTRGQLETAYLAKEFIKNKEDGFAIYNCDTYFECPDLEKKYSGVVPCATGIAGNSWSFASFNSKTRIADKVVEKQRISDHASVGYYGFSSWNIFEKYAVKKLNTSNQLSVGELYIAPLYNDLIYDGHEVYVPEVSGFYPFGTPEQIKEYWSADSLKQNETKKGTLVIDLDHTITIDGQEMYSSKKPNFKLIEKIRQYKEEGFEIIIYTARNMKTQKSDVSKVLAHVGFDTLSWLKQHEVPFDGIQFGKPFAENAFYVDDRAIRPDEFLNKSYEELMKLVGGKNANN